MMIERGRGDMKFMCVVGVNKASFDLTAFWSTLRFDWTLLRPAKNRSISQTVGREYRTGVAPFLKVFEVIKVNY
jgi:hypothetical protein